MEATILAEVRLTLSTPSSRRNVQDLVAPLSLDTATNLTNSTCTLAPNNGGGNNVLSTVSFAEIRKFLHLVCSIPTEVTLTVGTGQNAQSMTLVVERHLTITAPFAGVVVRNTSTANPSTIKAIFA